MLSEQELRDKIEDILLKADHKYLVDELARELKPIVDKAYNTGFSDGAGELPF